MATFVLLHGAYQGGWIWKPVRERLAAAGHTVFAPTLDGCAERAVPHGWTRAERISRPTAQAPPKTAPAPDSQERARHEPGGGGAAAAPAALLERVVLLG